MRIQFHNIFSTLIFKDEGRESTHFKIEKHEKQFEYNFSWNLVFSFRMEEAAGVWAILKNYGWKKNCKIVIQSLTEKYVSISENCSVERSIKATNACPRT